SEQIQECAKELVRDVITNEVFPGRRDRMGTAQDAMRPQIVAMVLMDDVRVPRPAQPHDRLVVGIGPRELGVDLGRKTVLYDNMRIRIATDIRSRDVAKYAIRWSDLHSLNGRLAGPEPGTWNLEPRTWICPTGPTST